MVRRATQMLKPPEEPLPDLETEAQLPDSASYVSRSDDVAVAELGRAHRSH